MDLNHARLPIPPLRRVDASQELGAPSGSIIIVKEQLAISQSIGYSPLAFRYSLEEQWRSGTSESKP
jgi:hypothetical protein